MDTGGKLNVVSAKLLAVAELIKTQDAEHALGSDKANFGLGEILADLVRELAEIEEELASANRSAESDGNPKPNRHAFGRKR